MFLVSLCGLILHLKLKIKNQFLMYYILLDTEVDIIV